MFFYKTDSIFNSKCEAICNPVNCVGIMGKGLALQFKNQYPDMFSFYKKLCDTRQIKVNETKIYTHSNELKIILFPTKNHWKNPSKLEWIENGLEDLLNKIKEENIK